MTEKNIISGYNFSQKCNLIYSRYISYEEFNDLDQKNIIVLQKTRDYIFYKIRKIELSENDTIFCNNFTLKSLFNKLHKVTEFNNIKLVTSQTDLPITKELYELKPDCISKWFSINVDYDNNNLVPIPLGIGNSFQQKYINPDLLLNFQSVFNFKRKPSIYINFRENTNKKHRRNIINRFQDFDWVSISPPTLSPEKYMNQIKQNSFTLAPWGNGVDTHRIWESLYLGSIPITKYHKTLNTLEDLPILFVENYSDINLDLLNKTLSEFNEKNFNFDKLNLDWWMDKKIEYTENLTIAKKKEVKNTIIYDSFFKYKYLVNRQIENKKKKLKFFISRVFKFLR
tara:strand:+ start:671 stop:1693 length:1023 start_codon:yes stop_codon:yes gene_type:complete